MDFSNCPLNDRYYSGSEKKLGIMLKGNHYMLKFQKQTARLLQARYEKIIKSAYDALDRSL
jgi:hypothetical protein